jgi:hypothetical protein
MNELAACFDKYQDKRLYSPFTFQRLAVNKQHILRFGFEILSLGTSCTPSNEIGRRQTQILAIKISVLLHLVCGRGVLQSILPLNIAWGCKGAPKSKKCNCWSEARHLQTV